MFVYFSTLFMSYYRVTRAEELRNKIVKKYIKKSKLLNSESLCLYSGTQISLQVFIFVPDMYLPILSLISFEKSKCFALFEDLFGLVDYFF